MRLTKRAAQTDSEPETVDSADSRAGKGRPTPKRRDAEGRRGPVTAPKTRKEAYARQKQLTKEQRGPRKNAKPRSVGEQRAALRRGDPDSLPRRDQGNTRKLARDYVDSRWMLSSFLLLLFPIMIASYIIPGAQIVVLVLFLVIVVEWYITGKRIRAMAKERFGAADGSAMSIGFYAGSRAYLPRKWRLPGPQVARGGQDLMFASTMQDYALTTTAILRHGARVYPDSQCVTWTGDGARRATYVEIEQNAERLASALVTLGVETGDRVATFCWNSQEHLEAYYAVPGMGAVVHTLNIRLPAEQLVHIVNHAEDRVIIVDDSLLPLLAPVADQFKTVETFVVVGTGDASALPGRVERYADLLAAESPGFEWPELDERSAASMCYTSGTTGDPKGVVYSHRSTYLHAMATLANSVTGGTERDRILTFVPMFHVNAWGIPFGAFLSGSSLHFPGRFMTPEPICDFIRTERSTMASAVPTIWAGILAHGQERDIDLSSLRLGTTGGAAMPRSLMAAFEEKYGLRIIQGWGMTETSPVGGMAHPPADVEVGAPDELDWRLKSGRVIAGVEMRIVADDGTVLPWDGEAVGEIEVRGPWITGSYYGADVPEKFHDGWLRTGDIGTIDRRGFFQITDRSKDVIKSGGEWISSVELENLLAGAPGVVEVAVIGIPDERWTERPLACVVRRGDDVTAESLVAFLDGKVATWQIPENWTFVDEVPKTTVGKFDKKVLRAQFADGAFAVERTK